MVTGEQLQDVYVKSKMNSYKHHEQIKMRDMGVVGNRIPPLVNVEMMKWVDENIYKGNTVAEKMAKHFNIEWSGSRSDLENKLTKKYGIDELIEWLDKNRKGVIEHIENLFDAHKDKINS